MFYDDCLKVFLGVKFGDVEFVGVLKIVIVGWGVVDG